MPEYNALRIARICLIGNTQRSLYKNKTNCNITFNDIENSLAVRNDLILILRAAKMDDNIDHYQFCYTYDVDRDKGILIVNFDISSNSEIEWDDEKLVFTLNQIANDEESKSKAKTKEDIRNEQKQRHKDQLATAKQELSLYFDEQEPGLWTTASTAGIDVKIALDRAFGHLSMDDCYAKCKRMLKNKKKAHAEPMSVDNDAGHGNANNSDVQALRDELLSVKEELKSLKETVHEQQSTLHQLLQHRSDQPLLNEIKCLKDIVQQQQHHNNHPNQMEHAMEFMRNMQMFGSMFHTNMPTMGALPYNANYQPITNDAAKRDNNNSTTPTFTLPQLQNMPTFPSR